MTLSRRRLLEGAGAGLLVAVLPRSLRAEDVDAVLRRLFGERRPEEGGVILEVASLVESGNSVAVTVRADPERPPPRRLHLVMPRNPTPWGLSVELQPPALPELATRVRLAGTQNLTAIAEWDDGGLGATAVSVMVTRGACIDENFEQWVR